jgi:hypothetical protein
MWKSKSDHEATSVFLLLDMESKNRMLIAPRNSSISAEDEIIPIHSIC